MLAPLIKLLGIICKKKGHTAWFIDYSSWLHNLVTRLSVKEDFFLCPVKENEEKHRRKKDDDDPATKQEDFCFKAQTFLQL